MKPRAEVDTTRLVKVSCPNCRTWRLIDDRGGRIKAGVERRHFYQADCIYELRQLLDEATAIIREQNRGRSGPGGNRLNDFLDAQTWTTESEQTTPLQDDTIGAE